MAEIGNTISSDLAAQIQLLSIIKADNTLDPAEKEAKLKQEGVKTLDMIAKEKDSLSIVNSAFASNIQDVIQSALASDDWDGIPPPTEMRRGIFDLQQVSQAIAIALNNGFNDVNDVLKLLMEINFKNQLSGAKEWLTHIKSTMEAASAQFANTEESIRKQKTADRTAAIGQIVGGSLSCAMNVVSMTGSVLNAKKQLSALKTQKTMHGMKDGLEVKAAELKQASEKLGIQKAEFEKIKATKPVSPAEIEAQDIKVASHEAIHIEAEKTYSAAKNSYREAKHQAEKISIKGQRDTAIWNGVGASGNGANTMSTGVANLYAADDRADSSLAKLAADRAEFLKNLLQTLGQNAYDRTKGCLQFVDKCLQTQTTIGQSYAGAISTISNKV